MSRLMPTNCDRCQLVTDWGDFGPGPWQCRCPPKLAEPAEFDRWITKHDLDRHELAAAALQLDADTLQRWLLWGTRVSQVAPAFVDLHTSAGEDLHVIRELFGWLTRPDTPKATQ